MWHGWRQQASGAQPAVPSQRRPAGGAQPVRRAADHACVPRQSLPTMPRSASRYTQVALSFIFPWSAYYTAEALELSGIVAIMMAGIVMALYTRHSMSDGAALVSSKLYKVIAQVSFERPAASSIAVLSHASVARGRRRSGRARGVVASAPTRPSSPPPLPFSWYEFVRAHARTWGGLRTSSSLVCIRVRGFRARSQLAETYVFVYLGMAFVSYPIFEPIRFDYSLALYALGACFIGRLHIFIGSCARTSPPPPLVVCPPVVAWRPPPPHPPDNFQGPAHT